LPQKKKPEKKKASVLAGRGKKARVERSGTLYYPCFFIVCRLVGAWHNFAAFFVGLFIPECLFRGWVSLSGYLAEPASA
jgi:hypothetical protein